MIAVILYAYLGVSALVALRLAWHIAFVMDRYDRRYNRGMYSSLVSSSLLWPLLFLNPTNLVSPAKLLTGMWAKGPSMAERARLADHPPPCGQSIRYCPALYADSGVQGEFLFLADDAEGEIRHTPVPEAGGMLRWLSNRDPALPDPTDVPEVWNEFNQVAGHLLRGGKAKRIQCRACQSDLSAQDLVIDDTFVAGHQCADRYACPAGHTLLLVETIRLIMRAPSQEPAEMGSDL